MNQMRMRSKDRNDPFRFKRASYNEVEQEMARVYMLEKKECC